MIPSRTSQPTPLRNVLVHDAFWDRYTGLVREKVLPYQWEALNDRVPGAEKSHAVENFRIAAGFAEGEFHGYVFQDSDLAKWLEAGIQHGLVTLTANACPLQPGSLLRHQLWSKVRGAVVTSAGLVTTK